MGIQQIQVTVTGNLGADPKSFGKSIDSAACSFRVGVTPRYYDGNSRQWRDRETTWVGVRAYRTLASNILGSLHKGDPVIVTGTLQTERWRKEGDPFDRITPVVDAVAVGHDLSQGVGRFRRAGREQPAANGQGDGAAGVNGAAGGGQGADPYNATPSNDPMAGARTVGANLPGLSVPSNVPAEPVELNVGAAGDDGAAEDGSSGVAAGVARTDAVGAGSAEIPADSADARADGIPTSDAAQAATASSAAPAGEQGESAF